MWGSTVGYIFAEALLKFLYSVCKGETDMNGPKIPHFSGFSIGFVVGVCPTLTRRL